MFEVDKSNSTIWFYDVVGADWFGGVTDSDFKAAQDKMAGGAYDLRVASPGGDVWTALAIYNLIDNYPGKVTVYVDSLAASAASYFPMAADEVVMAENALMMIHAPLTIAWGNAEEMRKVAGILDKHAEAMSKAYESKSGKSAEEIQSIFNEEVWYTAEEAKDAGFADSIVDDVAETETQINNSVFKFKNCPKQLVSNKVSKFAATVTKDNRQNVNALKARLVAMGI